MGHIFNKEILCSVQMNGESKAELKWPVALLISCFFFLVITHHSDMEDLLKKPFKNLLLTKTLLFIRRGNHILSLAVLQMSNFAGTLKVIHYYVIFSLFLPILCFFS